MEAGTFAPIQSTSYQVFFGFSAALFKALTQEFRPTNIYFLSDSNTAEHCLPLLEEEGVTVNSEHLITIPPGEANKDLRTCEVIWSFLHKKQADRHALLVNVGGGVITDLGGFAASVYKRGIAFLQVPTTLLAQVDAAVGAKTGIDFQAEKNMIGTFTASRAVVIDERFLKTLQPAELNAGSAEMIKHGLIADVVYFRQLAAELPAGLAAGLIPTALIYRSVEIKNSIILQDPYEKGLRKTLNFGHTAGHAIETLSHLNGLAPVRHGEAIGVGMIVELFLSALVPNGLPLELRDDCAGFLFGLFGKRKIAVADYEPLVELMKNDKKNEGRRILFTLITSIGHSTYDNAFTQDEIRRSFDYYNLLFE